MIFNLAQARREGASARADAQGVPSRISHQQDIQP